MHLRPHGGRLDTANDDVFGPQRLDGLLGILTGPLTNGHQRDHRPHANDHAQHRQCTAQFVQAQALEAHLNDTDDGKTGHGLRFWPSSANPKPCPVKHLIRRRVL